MSNKSCHQQITDRNVFINVITHNDHIWNQIAYIYSG